MTSAIVFELTVDEYVCGRLELPALTERPVPNGAAVSGAVVLLGGHDGQDGPDLKLKLDIRSNEFW